MLLNQVVALAGDLPGFDNGALDYIQEQAGFLIIAIVVLMVGFYLVKQSWGKLVGTIIIGGIVFFIAGSPEQTLDKIGNIFETFLGG